MISKGIQETRLKYSANEIIKEIKSFSGGLEEHQAKVLLYKFLRNNPMIAANIFLGLEIYPFQAIAAKGMMVADYSMFVLPRGGSKSWTFAVSTILQCLLEPNSNIGILSSSFRQAKIIMGKIEELMGKPQARLARECGFYLQKGTDQWVATIGNSKVTALPLGDGAKLRGFRFNMIGIDEFMNVPEKIFNEIILPFLSVVQNPTERDELAIIEDEMIRQGKMKEEDRHVWPNNKLVLLSSPSYTFQYMYTLYKKYVSLIHGDKEEELTLSDDEKKQRAYRFVMQVAQDELPKRLYDANLLAQARATMSEVQFNREFGAQFVEESDGFFRLSKMVECTVADGDAPAVEIKGNHLDDYILAFDPNISSNKTADHFAIQIFKLDYERKRLCIVHTYAIAGVDLKDHIKYFLYLLENFNIVGMVGDAYGGDAFIKACNESEAFADKKLKIGLLTQRFDHLEEYAADLVEMKKEYNKEERKYCFLRNPTSNWIRQANEMLQGSIDHKRVWFGAAAVEGHKKLQLAAQIPVKELTWDLKSQAECDPNNEMQLKFDFLDKLKSNVELTKIQCSNIDVKTTPQGYMSFQLAQHLKGSSGEDKARKDCYSALVLGNWFGKLYFDMLESQEQKKVVSTFVPFLV